MAFLRRLKAAESCRVFLKIALPFPNPEKEMRTITFLCTLLFLITVSTCDILKSPSPQNEISGVWKGKISSMKMEMRLSKSGSQLGGEIVWQVADPAYMADIGSDSYLAGDSVYIFLLSPDYSQNTVCLRGKKRGETMSGTYHRLDRSVPLDENGVWAVIKNH
jgi:hypothetical protein